MRLARHGSASSFRNAACTAPSIGTFVKGLKNTIETYGLLEHNPPPFQNTAMRRATIRSGMRLSLLTETHIGTPVGLKRLFT